MTTMSCEEFRRKYRALMKDDEDLSPTRLDEMEKHAVACKNCRSWLASTELPQATGKALTIVGCGSFRRGWIEMLAKTEENYNPGLDALAHLDNCESCQKWCDKLFAEQVASLGVSLKDLGDMLQKLQDSMNAFDFGNEPKK